MRFERYAKSLVHRGGILKGSTDNGSRNGPVKTGGVKFITSFFLSFFLLLLLLLILLLLLLLLLLRLLLLLLLLLLLFREREQKRIRTWVRLLQVTYRTTRPSSSVLERGCASKLKVSSVVWMTVVVFGGLLCSASKLMASWVVWITVVVFKGLLGVPTSLLSEATAASLLL